MAPCIQRELSSYIYTHIHTYVMQSIDPEFHQGENVMLNESYKSKNIICKYSVT